MIFMYQITRQLLPKTKTTGDTWRHRTTKQILIQEAQCKMDQVNKIKIQKTG